MSDSPMTLIDCISLHHHYRGWLRTDGRRLSDLLSDMRSDAVDLRDVQITAAGNKSPVIECSQLTLLKDRILIAVPRDSHERPASQRLDKYQKKERHGVVIVLPGHVLSGVMHLPRTSHTWSLIRDGGAIQPFVGLTNVAVHNAVFRLMPQTCPLAIVQRDAVEAIEFHSAPLKSTSSMEAFALTGEETGEHS